MFLLEAFDVTSRLPGHRIMAGKRLEFAIDFSGGERMWCWLHDRGAARACTGALDFAYGVLVLLARFCEGASPTRKKTVLGLVGHCEALHRRDTRGTHRAYPVVTSGKVRDGDSIWGEQTPYLA